MVLVLVLADRCCWWVMVLVLGEENGNKLGRREESLDTQRHGGGGAGDWSPEP